MAKYELTEEMQKSIEVLVRQNVCRIASRWLETDEGADWLSEKIEDLIDVPGEDEAENDEEANEIMQLLGDAEGYVFDFLSEELQEEVTRA